MQIKQPKSVELKTKERKLNNGVNWQGAFTVKGRKRMDGYVTV